MSRAVSMMLLWVGLLATLLAGCSRGPTQVPSDGLETQVTDPQSGVILRTHIDRATIAAADRLAVDVELEWASPARATLIEPDWAASGWTLIEQHDEPAKLTDSGFVARSTYLIEPFLPGSYTIPVFGAQIFPASDAEPYQIESLTMEVQVRSVLDEQDAGELAPADGLIDPITLETPGARSTRWVYALVAAVAGIAGVVIWKLTRSSGDGGRSPSVYAQLEHVANGRDASDAQACHTLYRAFTRLDERLQRTSEIREMIEQCERARFSAGDTGTLDPRAMARHTLELLGASPDPTTGSTASPTSGGAA